jgi:hypothetical protein
MRRCTTLFLAICVSGCRHEPDTIAIREWVKRNRIDLDNIVKCFALPESEESQRQLRDLLKLMRLEKPHLYSNDTRCLCVTLYSHGTVAGGVLVSLVWVPQSETTYMERRAAEASSRFRYEKVDEEWWLEIAR